MKEAFKFTDEKSSKFWWIDYEGTDFVVNFGKAGTTGRFQIKEFETEQECEKEALKLIAQKTKKGYTQDPDFDFQGHLYFDDEEIGLHPKTSHPNFRKYFTNKIYMDCVDEETPFGSDEGADTLYFLQEALRKNKDENLLTFAQKLIEDDWEMRYIPSSYPLNKEDFEKLLAEQEDNIMNILQTDQVIIAVAFGGIKIKGTIPDELKKLTLLAMDRIDLLSNIQGYYQGESEVIAIMRKDLHSFPLKNA